MTYPSFLYPDTKISFVSLPKPYQEFLVRWYYYDTSDDSTIPDTVPVEHIDDYVVQHMNPAQMWVAKGFACAKNVDESKDNLDFKNDFEFHICCIYVARLFWDYGIKNDWFKEDVSKADFLKGCYPFNPTYGIRI